MHRLEVQTCLLSDGARLVELELIDRERRMIERRIKAAKFPTSKSLDSFDFKAIPKLNKMQVLELARCEWIERRENVIALGPSGTGKTHVALGLGLASTIPGRNPALDGFGLIAFASLFPMITVMGYAQLADWRARRAVSRDRKGLKP